MRPTLEEQFHAAMSRIYEAEERDVHLSPSFDKPGRCSSALSWCRILSFTYGAAGS
jgi:hypothetical protein